ncbi:MULTISPECIES: hypothetical protein [Candidatus Cardinium]|uniref:hypothetical protein n=1 Tax=Candidatus Cardinium TaxID=273135 RepID=UPI001FA97B02|nr:MULTISPECIES: hypothetical protein [Cardinium]
MSKKLWLGWGAFLGTLALWFLIPNSHKGKLNKKLYLGIQRASLSIVKQHLLSPWVKKIVALLF